MPLAANTTGDFSPLAVGNTWVYRIDELGAGFWWNPQASHRVHRTLRVESRLEEPGGKTIHVLSYRDSLISRTRTPDVGSTASSKLPDSLRTGHFQVIESAGDGQLTLRQMGDPIPAGMELFFRRRFRSGEIEFAVSAGGDTLHVVPVTANYRSHLNDYAVYARDLGLIKFRRYYDVWGEEYHTPGYLTSDGILESFNGRPVPAIGPFGQGSYGSLANGFSGLKQGRSWRYRGLRQVVPGQNMRDGNHFKRDSVLRHLVVIGVTYPGGQPTYRISLRDSLYHRTYDGQPQADTLDAGTITVIPKPDSSHNEVSMAGGSRQTRDDAWHLFNRQTFLEESLDLRDFGSGPIRVMEYRAGFPGFLEDTWVHAEGIGLVRRSKFLAGKIAGLTEHIDLRLVELDGKPFQVGPDPVRLGPAPQPRRLASPSPAWGKIWKLRNLLGRIQEP